jgi:hypothetical protein
LLAGDLTRSPNEEVRAEQAFPVVELRESLENPGSGKMTASRYIARLMGPVLLAIGIGMIVGLMTEGDSYAALMKEFVGSRALIFLMGALTLAAGLAIVNAHNLWVPDWRVLVTVLGWLFIIRGAFALVFPTLVQRLGEDVSAGRTGIVAGAAVTLVLGAFLSVMGYRKERAGSA